MFIKIKGKKETAGYVPILACVQVKRTTQSSVSIRCVVPILPPD